MRIPGVTVSTNAAPIVYASTPALQQVEVDAQLAAAMQNALFQDMLTNDPEFVGYLRAHPDEARSLGISLPPVRGTGAPSQTVLQQQSQQQQVQRSSSAISGPPPPQPSSGSISQTLSSMGADMKRRLGTLAARFRRDQAVAAGSTTTAGTPVQQSRSATAASGGSSWFPRAAGYTSLEQSNGDDRGTDAIADWAPLRGEHVSDVAAVGAAAGSTAAAVKQADSAAATAQVPQASGSAVVTPSPLHTANFAIADDDDEPAEALLRRHV